MKATRLTFLRVAKGSIPAAATIRPGVEEVSAFLSAHVEGLVGKAKEGSAADAKFVDDQHEQVVEDLRSGSELEFLAAADLLADRLSAEMNRVGNPAPGLLVCVTLQDDLVEGGLAAVLKLEVVSDQGAVLRRLDSGEETLAAVQNVLDRPGDLQKGLVYPDSRPQSWAVVGDKAAQQEARYFLKSLGIVLDARPNASAAAFVSAVGRRVDRDTTKRVIETLPEVSDGSAHEVLQGLQQKGIDLPDDVMASVEAELVNADRPVPRIDVSAPVKGRIRAGSVTISGPANDISAVTWSSDPSGGWTTTIRSDTEPKVTWT